MESEYLENDKNHETGLPLRKKRYAISLLPTKISGKGLIFLKDTDCADKEMDTFMRLSYFYI